MAKSVAAFAHKRMVFLVWYCLSQVEYNQPAGGGAMNDLNNPPSTHMPDMGAINDLSSHRPVPQGSPGRMDFPPLVRRCVNSVT